MLHRIAQREEAAAGALQAIAERDQFLPAIDADPPAELQIAGELLGFDPEIGHIGVAPNERMKRLDVAGRAAVFFAAINFHRAGIAHLDRDNPRRRIGAEEQGVFLERPLVRRVRGFPQIC